MNRRVDEKEYEKLKHSTKYSLAEKVQMGIFPSKEELIQLYNNDKTENEICDFFNMSRSTFKKLRKMYDLPIKQRCVVHIDYNQRKEAIFKGMDEKYGISDETKKKEYYEQRQKKIQQTCLQKYGTIVPGMSDESVAKRKNTLLEKYGVDNPMKSSEIQEKTKKTDLEKYGVPFHIISEEVKEKSNNTVCERYGNRSLMSLSPEVIQKKEETNLQRYGVIHVFQNQDIREKGRKTMYENGDLSTPCSTQQKFLHEILGGYLNYPVGPYSLDIYLEEKNIGIEYDGGGHNLGVKIGRITQEQFNIKEEKRQNFFLQNNIPIIRFVSPKDRIPEKEELLCIFQQCEEKIHNGEKIVVIYF